MHKREIEELIRLVEESQINELEIWEGKTKVRITKGVTSQGARRSETPELRMMDKPEEKSINPAEAAELAPNLKQITSPMVGTFYRAPAPDAEPFVDIGQKISVGQTVCIVEAMKLMNEIGSDYNGVVREVYIDNAQPVEYGQPLFAVEIA